MFSEKDMEDAIASNPKRYIGEDGLQLLARQYRVGGYIFDLLFEDRHGAKLIVEIQKGTLDRQHTYKIMDYYDGFREKHPDEFIELMVIANHVPEERKKRLRFWGVEFREVPTNEFETLRAGNTDYVSTKETNSSLVPEGGKVDASVEASYFLFKQEKNTFIEQLREIDPSVTIRFNWADLNSENIKRRTNWFVCFIPSTWGVFTPGVGVHFGFNYSRDRKTGNEYVRLPVGVEKPLKREFAQDFKNEVVRSLSKRNIKLRECAVWPNAGAKLIEPTPVLLKENVSKELIHRYLNLNAFSDVVSEIIAEYKTKGCFQND